VGTISPVPWRRSQRRGGDAPHVPLNPELAEQVSSFDDQVVKMDDALEALKGVDEARLVLAAAPH